MSRRDRIWLALMVIGVIAACGEVYAIHEKSRKCEGEDGVLVRTFAGFVCLHDTEVRP